MKISEGIEKARRAAIESVMEHYTRQFTLGPDFVPGELFGAIDPEALMFPDDMRDFLREGPEPEPLDYLQAICAGRSVDELREGWLKCRQALVDGHKHEDIREALQNLLLYESDRCEKKAELE